jgi:hypothetical protein
MTRRRTKTATILRPAFLSARSLPALSYLLIICFGVIALSGSAQARERPKPKDYALIVGTVWGPDDHPVPGMKVKIRRAGEKKARWQAYSNLHGEFQQRLPVGKQDYVIWADTKGYKPPDGKHLQPGTEVTVRIENNERADTGLHLK